MKVRDVIRILESNGFELDRTRGSHRQFEGIIGGRRRLVTVSDKDNQDVKPGTLNSIRRQSGLPRKAFRQERAGK
ncbi:MAG: type II toxin-antitoxin system HicA family toxin [Gammaproteobacteria bacterium]|nr:type II toxin-antitoxin system HicA family toxin [Gammaproteobacteria bacterium]